MLLVGYMHILHLVYITYHIFSNLHLYAHTIVCDNMHSQNKLNSEQNNQSINQSKFF